MPVITIGAKGQFETIVSPQDYDYLRQYKWTFKRSSVKYAYAVYARRCIRVGGRKITVLMAHVILERMGKPRPTPAHTSEHGNGKPLDNQRDNLSWATMKEQCNNPTPRRKAHWRRMAAASAEQQGASA